MKTAIKNKVSNKLLKNTIIDLSIKKHKADIQVINSLLIEGENLSALRLLIDEYGLAGSVDLVYIDPPFATNTTFTIDDHRVSTVSHSKSDRIAYTDTLTGEAFLQFLRERLLLIKKLMSNKASIYLHIDYKIGHYVKILMDEIFGTDNFRNDITRIKCNPKNFKRNGYGNIKDLILFYTKTDDFTWNEPTENRGDSELLKLFNKTDTDGRRYTTNPLHAPGETIKGQTGQKWNGIMPPKGRHWRYSPDVLTQLEKEDLIEWSKNGVPRKKIYMEDYATKRVQDIWKFKDKQRPIYPTEKNLDMLERIIRTSSNQGDLIMDCFCGSGGFLYTGGKNNRRWIGIDSSKEAIRVTQERFKSNENLFFNGNFQKIKN